LSKSGKLFLNPLQSKGLADGRILIKKGVVEKVEGLEKLTWKKGQLGTRRED